MLFRQLLACSGDKTMSFSCLKTLIVSSINFCEKENGTKLFACAFRLKTLYSYLKPIQAWLCRWPCVLVFIRKREQTRLDVVFWTTVFQSSKITPVVMCGL
jgi:hypothetical protein